MGIYIYKYICHARFNKNYDYNYNYNMPYQKILSLTKQEGMVCNDTRLFLYNTAERFKQRKYPTDVKQEYLGVIQNIVVPPKGANPPHPRRYIHFIMVIWATPLLDKPP